ncbi:hypothetical protein JC965_23795 [Aeromonas caviae]|uniref:Uncharacterized protein n=1 Tax=Aeromonas caviae TaxID=648 RepID=A0A7T4C389_AERCA|nr:hypothetical protein [Aeromonas caviae]QQA60842.1 hypothetical protein JC965_23795 [Aeromonas caviae]
MPPLKAQLLLEESLSAYFPEMVFTDSGITVQLHRNTHPNQDRGNEIMYSQENGLRVKIPAFCANELAKHLPEGVKATRYIVDLILKDLANKKRGSHISDDATRNYNQDFTQPS